MIRIAISVEAFEAIAQTLPLGSVGFEPEVDQRARERFLAIGDLDEQISTSA